MAKKVYDKDGLDMRHTPWDGNASTENMPVSGRLVENYIKGIDDKTESTEDIISGETKLAQAGAVADAMTGVITDLDVQDSEDGTQYVMSYNKRKGDGTTEPAEVRFSKYTDDDKVVVSVNLTDSAGVPLPSSQYLSLGSGFIVKYSVSVGTAGGSAVDNYTNLQARVIVKRGNTVLSAFQNAEFVNVTAGQDYVFDASQYLTDASAYTVQIEARCDYEGTTLTRTASARVTMVAMALGSTFNVSNGLSNGGYSNDVTVPFSLTGTTGEKNIYYRLNGGDTFTLPMSTGSGTQSRNVVIGIADMTEGRNVLEVYAKHEPSGVISEAYYITLFKAGSVTDYTGLMFSHKAEGFQEKWQSPVLQAEQFTAWSIDYSGYDASSAQADVKVMQDGGTVKEDSLPRTEKGSYGKTNILTEALSYEIVCGTSAISLAVQTQGHPDIEATLASDAVCDFNAYGRSNTEQNAGTWKSGDLEMAFEDVLWQVNDNGAGSGWYNDRLLLSNGASMRLTKEDDHYYPFNEDDKPAGQAIADVGMTIEIEFSTANVTDTDAELISCLGTLANGNRYGLLVTPEEVKFLTGVKTTATDGGEIIEYEDSVGTKFKPNTNIKVAYTFYPDVSTNEQRTLIGFYVDGVESSASRWTGKVNFDILSELVFNSVGADLLVKNVRIYNKALSDDESLDNYIVDRNHLEDTADEKGVRTLDEENRVLDESGNVSLQKLLALMPKRKNSCLIFIGSGSVESEVPSVSDTMNILDALAQLNDKKANKLVKKIIFYNGEHPEQSFIAENVFVRIQGTSSVNYSRKNWRIYFQKTASGYTAILSYGEIDSNGEQKNPVKTEGKKNVFKLRPNSVGVKLACPKCDFSDSSMTTNTGGAKFFTDGMKEMGLLTPAQKYAQDHNLQEDYRASVDGLPCDIFAAKTEAEDLTYYGQYNMNNDKSESYPVFGQDKTIGGETWGEGDTLNYLNANSEGVKEYLPIAIETLNNSNPCCLFQWLPSADGELHKDYLDKHFDGGLELNHPKDVFWSSGKGDASDEPNMKEHLGTGDKYDKMYKSIDRLMSFINKCVLETEAGKNLAINTETSTFTGVDYADDGDKFPASKWKSAYFRAHADEFLNVDYSLAYYMFNDVHLAVDQFVKNILWRTWDGVIWIPTWYDGDCLLGNDNKSMLTGKYDDNRQTKRDGAYVMQGHNSWLWNLLLANFSDRMETLMTTGVNGGASFRSAFSVQKALNYFNTEQMDRWCERLYNKSGIFKYIYPFLNALPVGSSGTMQTYPQIYGMKGNLKAHRGYFIARRFDLKQVEYGYVSTNGASLYQSTSSQNAGHILAQMSFALTIPYRVQISTSNGVQADSGIVPANEPHTLALAEAFNENDPLKIIGAEKIRELTWHEDAFALGFNFGLFTSLVKLDMSVTSAGAYRNASFMTGTETMTVLEELVMTNNRIARNGDNGNVAALDLGYQSRLKKILLGGTGLERVTLATGCPVTELVLPATLTELNLEYLPRLADEGLTLEGINNVTGYRFEECPGVDGFTILERLHNAKANGDGSLIRFRIAVDMEDDGTVLERYKDYKTYTSTGANDNAHSGLVGKIRCSKFLTTNERARYKEIYPELEITIPEYTMVEYDDSISDDANISNLENKTGYKFGNKYVPSGHIVEILGRRHRVLAKVTKMPTSRNVNFADVNILMNNPDGEMTYYPLDDKNSYRYADGSDAKLDGTEGDWDMLEPFNWAKGINDYMNDKHYSCYCSFDREHKPSSPEATVLTLDDIKATAGGVTASRVVTIGKNTLSESYATNGSYSICKVDVSGFKRVRFPSVIGTNSIGSIFIDENERVVGSVLVSSLKGRFENGMYIISDIPEDAVNLYFSIYNSAEFDKVVLSNSEKIEDMEPDWVAVDEYLCGVAGSSNTGGKLRSCITGGSTAGNVSWLEFHNLSQQRGMQQIDAMMHSQIANFSYIQYGRRDMQTQCGAGVYNSSRKTGESANRGMQDTIGFDEAYAIDPSVTNSIIDSVIHQYAWYKEKDYDGKDIVTRVDNTCCIGYESIYGNKTDFMDGVDLPNNAGNEGKWRIWMPDGTTRMVKSIITNSVWITAVAHGKYMDMTPVGTYSGSSSTYFCDTYAANSQAGRVVYRGDASAYASGGVSYANAYHDASRSHTSVGSRLAFRGKLVKAESVKAYKAIVEKA